MKTFSLTISSPDGDIFKDDVNMISLRGTEGEFAIMAGHIPFVTAIVPCSGNIELADGTQKSCRTEGGILTVSSGGVTFLSGSFEFN